MVENLSEDLQKFIADGGSKKKSSPQEWANFVESTVVNFWNDNRIEKLSLEDGNGNKAKLSRTKDGVKIEYSSIVMR